MKLNKQEMTGCTKITLIISGAAMLAGIVIVVLFAARRARPFRTEPQRARDCDLRRAGGVFLHAVQIAGGT